MSEGVGLGIFTLLVFFLSVLSSSPCEVIVFLSPDT